MGGFLNTWLMELVLCCFRQSLLKRFVGIRIGAVHEYAGLRIMEIREDSVCSTVMQISAPLQMDSPDFVARDIAQSQPR